MCYKSFYFSLFLYGLFFTNAVAQMRISGVVKDVDNTAISYANVVLTNKETNTFILGTITDDDGGFNIIMDENLSVNITISFMGFESWSAVVNKTKKFNTITLSDAKNTLNEIVLLGTKAAITKKGDQLIFNVQNTPLKQGYDGLEILKVTPYVWVDGASAILMRDQVARVLINGRRVSMSGSELSNYLSNLSSENIERIEIQTNQSANVSAESTGGIINIILKQQALGFRGQIKSYYANRGNDYDVAFAGFSSNYGSEQWNLYGGYNIALNETFNEIENVTSFNETTRENVTLRSKETSRIRQNYQIGIVKPIAISHEIGVEVFGAYLIQDYTDLGTISYRENKVLIDSGRNDIDGTINSNRFNSVLNYRWSLGPKDKLIVIADYLKSKNDSQSWVNNVYENGTAVNSQNRYTPRSNTDVYAVQADYSKTLQNDFNIDFGLKHTQTDRFNGLLSEIKGETAFILNEDETTEFNYKENISAGYFLSSKTWKEKNYAKLGVRVENTSLDKVDFIAKTSLSQNFINWFPSLYYARTLQRNKTIAASYSRSLGRPSFRDLSDNITKINDFQFILGNPDLTPEFVSLFELSYNVKQSELSVYYKNTNDAINGIYFIENDIAFYKKFNAGSQVQYGLQYNTSKKIKSWWYLRFSSHLYHRKFVNEQGESSFNQATMGARIFNSFSISKTMSIDASGRYTSPKADAFYEAAEIYTANIMIKKSFADKKINLRIYFDDIFNSLRYSNVRQFNTFFTSADDKPRSRKLMLWLTYDISNNRKVLTKKNTSKNDASNRL